MEHMKKLYNSKNNSLFFLDVFKLVYFTFNLFANTRIRQMTTFWSLFYFVRKRSVSLNLVSDLLVIDLCIVIVLLNLDLSMRLWMFMSPNSVSVFLRVPRGIWKGLNSKCNTQLLVYFPCLSFLFPLFNSPSSFHAPSSASWNPRS